MNQHENLHFGLEVQAPANGAWFFVKRDRYGNFTYGIYPLSVVPASELEWCKALHPHLNFNAVPLAASALEVLGREYNESGKTNH